MRDRGVRGIVLRHYVWCDLADPMIGGARDRAERICRDIVEFGSETVIVSKIPGASHCATEGAEIIDAVRKSTGIPVQEIEVPPVIDSVEPTIRTRIEALCETARATKGPNI